MIIQTLKQITQQERTITMKKFVTHLKGGFSENKLSYKKQKSNLTFTEDVEDYITLIND